LLLGNVDYFKSCISLFNHSWENTISLPLNILN